MADEHALVQEKDQRCVELENRLFSTLSQQIQSFQPVPETTAENAPPEVRDRTIHAVDKTFAATHSSGHNAAATKQNTNPSPATRCSLLPNFTIKT